MDDEVHKKLNSVRPPHMRKRVKSNLERRVKNAIDRKKKIVNEKLDVLKKETRASSKELEKIEAIEAVVVENKTAIVTPDIIPTSLSTVKEELDTREVIFRPNPGPQTDFLAASEMEVFYGGARGGGKSYSLLVDPLRYCNHPDFVGLILRRTMPELRDLIMHSQKMYKKVFPKAAWREQEKEWKFPSGARLEFGFAENYQDALRYQGRAYTWIGIDELPQYPDPQIYMELRGSLRTTSTDLPTHMRATGNPGNVGSSWVKEMFIDPAPPGTAFEVEIKVGDLSKKITRKFIPAKLTDNPYLTKTDNYLVMLASLPEVKRRQWLEGDWDVWEGAAFPEFDRSKHVIEPFELPHSWVRFRACDWGYSSPACCLWFAVDYDNNLYVYKELFVKQQTADIFAQNVKLKDAKDRIMYGILDSSVWAKRGDIGPGIVETMRNNGVIWRPSDRSPMSRKNGKMEVHRRLAPGPEGAPTLKIFKNCVNLIKDLPSLPLDENDPEDVDTKSNDHSYDALRYGCMSRPYGPQRLDWLNAQHAREIYKPQDTVFGY